jgi:signal transduction histidine kinase
MSLGPAPDTRKAAIRLLVAGFAAAGLVAGVGRVLERSRFGATDSESVGRIEAELRQRVDAAGDSLASIAARVASSRNLIQTASRDDASARELFDTLAAALPQESVRTTGVTVYAQPTGVPIAWVGRVSDLPKERIVGPADLFVAPRGRLIRVEPVIDSSRPGTQRLATVVVEQLLGEGHLAPASDDALVVQTSLAPVSVRSGLAATTTRSPYTFLIPSRTGQVLIEADVKPADLAQARERWRVGIRAAVWAVVGVTLLMGCAVLIDIRRRSHQPGVVVLTTMGILAVLATARAAFWYAAAPFGTAREPIDFFLTALFAAGGVWLILNLVERRRLARRRPRLIKEDARAIASTVVVYVIAGAIGVAVLWTYERFLRGVVSQASLDLARLSLHPVVALRLELAFGLVLLHAAVIWGVTLVLRVAAVEWRRPRSQTLQATAIASWALGTAVAIVFARRVSNQVPLLPLLIAVVTTGACAAVLARPGGRARRASHAARLLALFLALVVPAIAMYPSLHSFATDAKEDLIANVFGPQAVGQRENLWRRGLQRALEQIDALPMLADFVTSSSEDTAPTTDRAFVVWSQTELADYRLTSAVELYGASGRLVSHFFLNLTEFGTTVFRAAGCDDWDITDESSPFGSTERHVLRATRSICQRGRSVGTIVVRAMFDYRDLPFIPAENRYLEPFNPNRPAPVEGEPGQDVEFIVYGWSKAPLYSSGTRVWPLSDEVFERAVRSRHPFWATVVRDDEVFRVYYVSDRLGIYALGYPVVTWFGHLVNIAELVTLTFVLYVLLVLAATAFTWLTALAPASGRALVREMRSSFYRKLFLYFVAVSVVPVGLLALATRTFFSSQLQAGVAEAAVNTATLAQRLVEDYAALQQQRGTRTLDLLDDQIMVLVGQAIDQDVDLFVRSRLQATSERDLYASGLLAMRTPSEVYRQIALDRRPTFVGIEDVGGLQYQIAAAPVRAGGSEGIVTVPQTLRRREIERQIDELNRRVVLGLVVFVLLGAFIGYSLAERIADPVNRLTRATRRIARGDLDARIAATSRDELRRLVEDFNHMAADLKRQRTELERTQRLEAWADMARQVAHDIKNPLTPIQLSAEHAQRLNADRGRPLSPALDECITSILTQVKLLRQIAAEFSSFASSPTAHPERTGLAALIDEVVQPYRVGLADRIAIDVRPATELPPVVIDRTLFARALTNIIENALHAMPGRGRLTITSQAGPDSSRTVVVEVADTGVGMDHEALSKIFEPYFSTKATGTGLGLTIAKRNVELNGGTISVESERGVGTTVRMILPAA